MGANLEWRGAGTTRVAQPHMLLRILQDLLASAIMCEAVYAGSSDAMRECVCRLARVMGMERPLTEVSVHNAAGQR